MHKADDVGALIFDSISLHKRAAGANADSIQKVAAATGNSIVVWVLD